MGGLDWGSPKSEAQTACEKLHADDRSIDRLRCMFSLYSYSGVLFWEVWIGEVQPKSEAQTTAEHKACASSRNIKTPRHHETRIDSHCHTEHTRSTRSRNSNTQRHHISRGYYYCCSLDLLILKSVSSQSIQHSINTLH